MQFSHYTIMFFIMILSSFCSTMNVWADKVDDWRFSLNDLYMALLMTGWMFFFMGIIYRELHIVGIGGVLITISLLCIRTQFGITERQYKLGMIPHHSMAVHMSKKLLEKESEIKPFLTNLIETQEKEIAFMKIV